MNKRIQENRLVFRLYITQGAHSSVRAMANLKIICRDYLNGNCQLEIIDTQKDPIRAMQDGIVVTPTLVKLAPEPRWTIVGDLSEDARVLASMYAVVPNGNSNARHQKILVRGGQHASFERTRGTPGPRMGRRT
ncbi:MAG: circadian clock protein KaiB [Chloroflexi bacterium]|nr:circadian clock protein KaiB [Chloroflexota bacterium]